MKGNISVCRVIVITTIIIITATLHPVNCQHSSVGYSGKCFTEYQIIYLSLLFKMTSSLFVSCVQSQLHILSKPNFIYTISPYDQVDEVEHV